MNRQNHSICSVVRGPFLETIYELLGGKSIPIIRLDIPAIMHRSDIARKRVKSHGATNETYGHLAMLRYGCISEIGSVAADLQKFFNPLCIQCRELDQALHAHLGSEFNQIIKVADLG